MRLTDEEKAIAEGVAAGWVRAGASWDAAWGLAMKYIATRRKAIGDDPQVSPETPVSLRSETPAPATAAGVDCPAANRCPAPDNAAGQDTPGDATAAGVAAPGAAAQAPPTFEDELADLINRHGIDSQHNTPDSVLSRFVMRALEAHRLAAEHRSTELHSVVAAPPADASDGVVAWYVEGGSGDPIRTWEDHCNAARVARACGGTVVPLVRQGSQGVRVTEEYRAAVRRAVRLLRDRNYQCVARLLDELLAVIDAANGGGA